MKALIFCLADGWVDAVMQLIDGRGVDVAFDSVGATLMDSFAAVRDCGRVVFYGMSGGDPEPADPRMLMDSSKTLTGGDLWSYLTSGAQRRRRADELFSLVASDAVSIREPVTFGLSAGADAHRFLESGKSMGKVLLIP